MSQKEELVRANELFTDLAKNNPEQLQAFNSLMKSVIKDGKVSAKTKEAVALGIAVKAQCKGCIVAHVKKSLDMGYTREEIMEIAWVAVLMGGGPSLVYLSEVKTALDEFCE